MGDIGQEFDRIVHLVGREPCGVIEAKIQDDDTLLGIVLQAGLVGPAGSLGRNLGIEELILLTVRVKLLSGGEAVEVGRESHDGM